MKNVQMYAQSLTEYSNIFSKIAGVFTYYPLQSIVVSLIFLLLLISPLLIKGMLFRRNPEYEGNVHFVPIALFIIGMLYVLTHVHQNVIASGHYQSDTLVVMKVERLQGKTNATSDDMTQLTLMSIDDVKSKQQYSLRTVRPLTISEGEMIQIKTEDRLLSINDKTVDILKLKENDIDTFEISVSNINNPKATRTIKEVMIRK